MNARTELVLANKADTTSDNVALDDLASELISAEESSTTATPATATKTSAVGGVRCSLCEEEVVDSSLAVHVKDYHRMSRQAYLKICPSGVCLG